MYSSYVLLILLIIISVFGIIEFFRHQKRLFSIPVRVHVNGTRGKSSVTRLIGAGLREGGKKCITKVTGTFPRLILEDGTETYIHRKAGANIIEQISIVKFVAERKADALVIECMALQPIYQTITEEKMIRSNVGVMTNVRYDHLDVMGHTLGEIAEVMGRTIPRNSHLFSSENIVPEYLEAIAKKKGTQSYFVDCNTVTKAEMNGFSYIEHRENVSLALAVCEHLGVNRQVALRGMYKAIPDAGVLTRSIVKDEGKHIVFYNVFAANDPDSTLFIWKKINTEIGMDGTKILLLNTRQDRLERSKQLADMAAGKIANEIDYIMLMGQSGEVVQSMLTSFGMPSEKIINLGFVEPQKVYEAILGITSKQSTIFAIGNMGLNGAATAEFFEHKSKNQ